MDKARRYVIWAQPYTRSCGTRVLYMLYERLRAAGCRALLFCPEEHLENYEYLDVPDEDCLAEDIAVYPEIVSGNPLRFARVVRYVLYFPGFLAGEAFYHPDELLFTWWNDYIAAPELYWNTIDRKLFRDEGLPRNRNCWFANKGRKRDIPEIAGATGITMSYPQSREELARLLKSTGTLYSFDDYSMLHDEAVLCGAKVKLVKERGLEDYRMRPLPDEAAEKAMLERFIEASQALPASRALQPEEPFLDRYVGIFYMAAVRCALAGAWPEALAFCRRAYQGKPLARPGLEAPQSKRPDSGDGAGQDRDEGSAVESFLALAASGDYPAAEAALLPLLERSVEDGNGPVASALLLLLSHCYELWGRSEDQIRAEAQALAADPLNALAVHLNALRSLEQGRLNQALHNVAGLLKARLWPLDMRQAVFAMALLGMILHAAPEKEAVLAQRLAEAMAAAGPLGRSSGLHSVRSSGERLSAGGASPVSMSPDLRARIRAGLLHRRPLFPCGPDS